MSRKPKPSGQSKSTQTKPTQTKPTQTRSSPSVSQEGAASRRTREIADREAESGNPLPLQIMLANMLFYSKRALQYEAELVEVEARVNGLRAGSTEQKVALRELMEVFAKGRDNRALSQAAAAEAAPYMHPRLRSIELRGKSDSPLIVQLGGSDAEL